MRTVASHRGLQLVRSRLITLRTPSGHPDFVELVARQRLRQRLPRTRVFQALAPWRSRLLLPAQCC